MFSHSITLYFAAVLIWGSTWYGIKFQLGEVDPAVSVAYRFALASVLLLAYCLIRRLKLRYSLAEHAAMAVLGACLFGFNYLLTYEGTVFLTSGLVAVLFSSIVLMNILNSVLFFRQPAALSMLLGAGLGLAGICLIFWPELSNLNSSEIIKGAGITLMGTYIASLGNLVSARNQKHGLPVIQANAYGMGYGALIIAIWAWSQGIAFNYSDKLEYSLSLVYLAVFGSILAFGSYLTLLGRVGPSKAAYATVLFPIVALAISTIFENYHWQPMAILGVALVLIGNVIIVADKQLRDRLSKLMPAKKTTLDTP